MSEIISTLRCGHHCRSMGPVRAGRGEKEKNVFIHSVGLGSQTQLSTRPVPTGPPLI